MRGLRNVSFPHYSLFLMNYTSNMAACCDNDVNDASHVTAGHLSENYGIVYKCSALFSLVRYCR